MEKFNQLLARINKQEFIDYFNSIHLMCEFKEKFNLNNKAYYRLLEYFNLSLSEEDKLKLEERRLNRIKSTNLEKYGVENVFQSEEIKNKIKQTNLLNFGVEYSLQSKEIREKSKNTLIYKYGVDNAAKSNIIKEKIKNTCLDKYGTNTPLQNKEIKEKIKLTNLSKYGVEYISQSKNIKDKIISTNTERYNVPYACMRKEAKLKGNNSKPNREFAELLDNKNIKYEREFSIGKYTYDFKIDNILIEINPSATHSSNIGIYNTEPKDKYYHFNKSKNAWDNKYQCVHIFDWEDKNYILNNLNKITEDCSKCIDFNLKYSYIPPEKHIDGIFEIYDCGKFIYERR